jgi:hypothetical protein
MPGATIAGTLTETAVPAPGSDSIASVPATRVTRWRIAVSPKLVVRASEPAETAKPTPPGHLREGIARPGGIGGQRG